MQFQLLDSADHGKWIDPVSTVDSLPIRPSGSWIDMKHRLLTHYAHMFATGMKNRWKQRIYLELFSGPGRCLIRGTTREEPGSPVKVIDHEFTRFIFTEMNYAAARALESRLSAHSNSDRAEIWCGDCAEAIRRIPFPQKDALTFAFIDPTGIGHAPFSLIRALHQATRCDLLINVQHAMGIKMNIHQYTPEADESSALTKFLGNDKWKRLLPAGPREFFLGVLDLYKEQLRGLGFKFLGREVMVSTNKNNPLYLLLFASKHAKGEEFWDKSMKGVQDPELGLTFN